MIQKIHHNKFVINENTTKADFKNIVAFEICHEVSVWITDL